MATGSKLRGLRAKLLLLLFAILLALVTAEVLLRVLADRFAPPADVQVDYPVSSDSEFTGRSWGLRPHAEFEGRYDGDPYGTLPDDGKVRYRLNDAGFRDKPFRARRKGHTVAVFGDSFVFGEGVAGEDVFTEVAERTLTEDSGSEFHVLNVGVPGFSTYEEAAVAEVMVPLLRPNTVILAYCLNDPVLATDPAAAAHFGFDLINRRDQHLDSRPSPIHLWRLFSRAIESNRLTERTLDWYHSMYAGPDAPWTRSRGSILEIRDMAGSASAEFAVVVLPMFIGLEEDYPLAAIHEKVAGFCEENGIPVLDTLSLFTGMRTESLIVHPKDRHPNARAHEIIGRAVAEFLLAQ